MREDVSRYIAEIEMPDGFASIDCEIEYSNKSKTTIRFLLNNLNYDVQVHISESKDLTFRKELELNSEVIIKTDKKDIQAYIEEILRDAYGKDTDITVRDIDMD